MTTTSAVAYHQRLEAERLYDLGHTPTSIAQELGVDLGRVNRIIDRHADRAIRPPAKPVKPVQKERVRVVYLAPPTDTHAYLEYAVLGQDGRTRPVSAATAQLEAASGATILARTVTAWRAIQTPTIEGAEA